MSDKYIETHWKKIIITVISGFILLLTTNTINGYRLKNKTIQSNTRAIERMEGSKVDQKKFNQFVKIQAEMNILIKERQDVMSKKLDELTEDVRNLELEKLRIIDIKISILETKIKTLMKEYGLLTRDGNEVGINLEWFIATNV